MVNSEPIRSQNFSPGAAHTTNTNQSPASEISNLWPFFFDTEENLSYCAAQSGPTNMIMNKYAYPCMSSVSVLLLPA